MKRLYYWMIGLLLLSSCGFQLRGTVAFTVKSVYVQAESANRVAAEVTRILAEQGVKIPTIAKEAQLIVFLRNEGVARRALSVSAVSGRLEEVELNVRVELEVQKPDGSVVLEKQLLSLLHDFSFDERALLAKDAEEQIVREELYRDIVAQVVRRIQSIKL